MSSALEISTADKPISKGVLHEHKKPTMGTNYVGAKTRPTAKRDTSFKEKLKDTATNRSDKKLRNYDIVTVTSNKHQISSESNVKKILPEKKNITKSRKLENVFPIKSDLRKHSDLSDMSLPNLNGEIEHLSKINTHVCDTIKTTVNMLHDDDTGSFSVIPDANTITKTQRDEIQNVDDTSWDTICSKYYEKDKSVLKLDLELSDSSEMSNQKAEETKIQHILTKTSLNELNTDKNKIKQTGDACENVTPNISCIRKQTPLKKSIPKPQSVILDSCDDFQQKHSIQSDENKHNSFTRNTSDLLHQECKMESDLDQIKCVAALTCKQTENLVSTNKKPIEQSICLSNIMTSSAQNIKRGKKSQNSYMQGNLQSYLRMTSSYANKEIKKKNENTQRSATRQNNSKLVIMQTDKYSNKTKSKCSNASQGIALKKEKTQKQKSIGKDSNMQSNKYSMGCESMSTTLNEQESQETSSRSRSTTPSAFSVSSDRSSSKNTNLSSKTVSIIPKDVKRIKTESTSKLKGLKSSQDSKLKKKADQTLETIKAKQMLKRDSKSKLRSNTPDKPPACSSNKSPDKDITFTIKSNKPLQISTLSSRSESTSSKSEKLLSNNIKTSRQINDKEKSPGMITRTGGAKYSLKATNSRYNQGNFKKDCSRSDAQRLSSSSSSPSCNSVNIENISNLNQANSDINCMKFGRNIRTAIDKRVKPNVTDASTSCSMQYGRKQKSPSRDLSVKEKQQSNTRSEASKSLSNISNLNIKLTSKGKVLRRQNFKISHDNDRKSRSRSSTPGATSCKTLKTTSSEPKSDQEKNCISNHSLKGAKNERFSKIPRDISAKARKHSNDQVSTDENYPQFCHSDKLENVQTSKYHSHSLQYTQALQTNNFRKDIADDDENSEIFICKSSESHDRICTSYIPFEKLVPGVATEMNSTHNVSESCNSYSTLSENFKHSECKVPSSKCNSRSKVKMLCTQECVKPILESTELCIKPDSRIKAGKIQNSVINKTSQLHTFSEKRRRLESGRSSYRNIAINTMATKNNVRPTNRMSAIKRDFISTKYCNKSEEKETCKQNNQLSGQLIEGNVNSKFENECVYKSGCVIGEEHFQIMETKEKQTCMQDKLHCKRNEIKRQNFTKSIQNETANKQIDRLKGLDSEFIGNKDKDKVILMQLLTPVILNNSDQSSDTKYIENPINKNCSNSEKYYVSASDKCSDREKIASDPKSEVKNNCLSDVRENEIQNVNCEINTGITAGRNTTENYDFEVFSFNELNTLMNKQNGMNLEMQENVNEMEFEKLRKCNSSTDENKSSLSTALDANLRCMMSQNVERDNSDTIYSLINTETIQDSSCNGDGTCNKLKYCRVSNLGQIALISGQQCLSECICKSDQKNETSAVKIDNYDVNSSNEMPIIEECAFKFTDFKDVQEDKAKCTHAVPVTGAVSLQSTNKRQDKKISPLSNCGKRNTALCSNKNSLLRDCDKVCDPHFDKKCESATMEKQTVTSIDKGNQTDVVMSSSMKCLMSDFTINKNASIDMASEIFKDSVGDEQALSNWKNAEIVNILSEENGSKLQVMNKCERNKGNYEQKNICENLDFHDNALCCEEQTLRNVQLNTYGVNSNVPNCGIVGDFNLENMDTSIQDVGHKTNHSHILLQDLSNSNINDAETVKVCCDDSFCMVIDKNLNENDKEISCIPLQNGHEEKGFELEGSQQENSLTCISENAPCLTDNENCSPERKSRTTDVKLITTDHDLSLPTQQKSTGEIKISTECRTGLLFSSAKLSTRGDKSFELESKDSKIAFNSSLPIGSVFQNKLHIFKPDKVLSEIELKNDVTFKPYVLESQEQQTNCFHYNGNEPKCLFVEDSITEDGLDSLQCENKDNFQQKEMNIPAGIQNTCIQDNGYVTNDPGNYEKNIFSVDEMNEKRNKIVPKSNNSSFCNIPKLSVMLCEMYPNLNEKNKKCSESCYKKEIKYNDRQCLNMTQNANCDTCFLNMKLNDSACLFQSYTHLNRDDIKVSSECQHCADLSQAPENISNRYSKKLHSLDDLTEANSTEHGSLKITGNKLCTSSLPCDGNEEKIRTHIILTKSTENPDLNDLSLSFDVQNHFYTGLTMSRDKTHVAAAGTDISSEHSISLTDNETLKTYNPSSNQDFYKDKKSCELSAVKITTQKNSCNLTFSEKSNELKDLPLRYEHHKNSAGHTKLYSCKDELDIRTASIQEEYNFRNLAAIRDEDINCEFKLNYLNLETPRQCVSSSLESARLNKKETLTGIHGQCSEIESNNCSAGSEKYFETPVKLLTGQINFDQERSIVVANKGDSIVKENDFLCEKDVLSDDIRLSCSYPEHKSKTDNLQRQKVENGLSHVTSIKTDTCQTERDVNALLTLQEEESNSKLNLPGKFIKSVSGFQSAENKQEIQSDKINLLKSAEPSCTLLEGQKTQKCACITHTDCYNTNKNVNNSTEIHISSAENCFNENEVLKLQDEIQDISLNRYMQSNNNSNVNVLNTQDRLSPSEETLSDASEAYIDAEDRLSSPYTENIGILHNKKSAVHSKELNISCGASTSTESFVDAVESLDDDYLTSTNFRNSREFQNEETVSQASSSANDSSTGIVGSMDDLSGWEEFSENIEDINDLNGEMEITSISMTNNERTNLALSVIDDQMHAPITATKHVYHDNNYPSPSPHSEATEKSLSKIKTNMFRYKDMRNGVEQKIIGSSIFETGDRGTSRDLNFSDVSHVANSDQNGVCKSVCHSRNNQNNMSVMANEKDIQLKLSGISMIKEKVDNTGNFTRTSENTTSPTAFVVDSKIETAVIKRTERRRRQQIEQQKCIACDSKSEDKGEKNVLNIRQREQAHNNESIEKSSCSHSENSKYSCTVSDNTTFNKEPASGTGELSQQINTTSELNETSLYHSLSSETPLSSDCIDSSKNQMTIQEISDKPGFLLTDKKNERGSSVFAKHLCDPSVGDTQCERKIGYNDVHSGNGKYFETTYDEKTRENPNNEIQLTIELQEQTQRNEVNLDDFEFIDADESNQECNVSTNVSFTFTCNESNKNIDNEKQKEIHNKSTNIFSEEHSSIDSTIEFTLSEPKVCFEVKIADNGTQSRQNAVVEKTVLEELQVICEKSSSKNCENTGESRIDPICINTDEMSQTSKFKENTNENYSDFQLNNANSDMNDIHSDICEESNISVKLALEMEKQKLAYNDKNRSRKDLFLSSRAGRRATIETCSFENMGVTKKTSEYVEETKGKPEIKKSESFRMERKQISPMASFMNPNISESNDNKNCIDNVDLMNKKVSDICKSFMTKTRSSAQKTRAKTLSKSPAPQRKLMKWVNNNGKWMRMPVDDAQESENNTTVNSTQSELSVTSDSNETNSPVTREIKIDLDSPKSVSVVVNENERKNEKADHFNCTSTVKLENYAFGMSETKLQFSKQNLFDDFIHHEHRLINEDKTSVAQKDKITHPLNIEEKMDSSKEIVFDSYTMLSSSEVIHGISENDDIKRISDVPNNTTDRFSNMQHISTPDENAMVIEQDSTQTAIHTENETVEAETEAEIKVIGTTFDDTQSDQERHRQRQELLFGLLDSFNRRKPRRITLRESDPNIQSSKNSDISCVAANKPTTQCSGNFQNQETISDGHQKSTPKIRAVKIQEEVFECKTEYLKDANVIEASECNINASEMSGSYQSVTEKVIQENGTAFKPKRLHIKKSKTFAGLGDIERQRYISRRLMGETNVLKGTKKAQTVCEKTESNSIYHGNVEKAIHTQKQINTIKDKRLRAGLKLNLDEIKVKIQNDLDSDRSPSRLGPEKSRRRSPGDRSPNRLFVDQQKVRLRSPDKGPKQLQRCKLLSEIVEVEENKDEVTVTCDQRRQQQQQYYNQRQRQEGTKAVKRSNKRRSLSLPTGTLAFGDARIVYKNGHFTIETMDNSEYDNNESTGNLHTNIDDMWDMPDTSEDYSRPKSDSRETTDIHNKPHMRRQNAKTVLQSSDSTEDVFYNDSDFSENVSPSRLDITSDSKVLNMGRTSEEVFNESCSSRTSDMSIDSYYSEGMDFSTDESVTDSQKLSSSSLPETKDIEVKRVMQRAKRTSSFRAAQEGGALRLSGIDEDKVHNSTRARSVSLDENQKSNLNKSPKIQSVQNQNPTFLKKVMAKRKTRSETLNISGFSKQSESAKEFFTKKMTLKGLFRKNKSDSSVNSPIKTEHPVSPPIATFQDDDIGSVDTPPGSPYRNRNIRRRHTSADILKTYPDSSETDSNCPTPTQERSNKLRHSISSPSTPSHEANSFLNLSSHSSAPKFRDDDEMSITSASSFASSIHSPPLEQPHKPKTPKPVGASPRRNQSFSSQLSRSSSQSSQRNVMNSVTSLESDQYEPGQEDVMRDPRCECAFRSEEHKRRMSHRNLRGSTDSITMCQFCKQMEFYKSDSAFSNSSFYKQQLTGKEKQSDDGARLRKDSSGRNNYDRLGIISQADVASSNSNDSGIQRDASLHSSNESIKGAADTGIRLRRNKSLSPHPDRPKSEIGVRWADGDCGDYDVTETTVKLRNKRAKDRPRPKSDLEDNIHLFDELFEEVLEDFETDGSSFLSARMKAFGSEINLQPYCSLRSLYEMKRNDLDRQKNRRMSTPHPIKSRLQRAPQKLHKQQPLVRSSSMPESLEKIHKRRKMHHLLDFHLDTLSRHMEIDTLSDESDLSFDQSSLQERSISVQSSSSQLTAMDEDEDNLTYAEALWDHITMDPEELGFRAQDVIEVLDMADRDWWYGVIDDREGWFPATFVRIRVNQDELDDDLDLDTTIQDNLTTSPKLRRISMFNKNQARSNVVNEIINAEREYVKHLKDVVEGYIQHARKRTEMFPEERIALIFGNLEKIYSFAQKFVSQLEMCIDVCPHLSEIGQCFLDNERGFEIYSDYCNNHPSACEELDELCKDSKYKHFFEACRLLQELVEIPLEGFLLTPVQKICKYPLQLAELLKYTPPDHADYVMVKDALAAMRKIATLINERKRKMESIEKIAVWQHSVVDWEGPDLLEGSSELIFSGELNKINSAGWSQERFFFLFDHQVVYCKKELLKRHVFSYKGRIDLDNCDIVDIPDGKDSQYNVTVKHAWKFHETLKDKWYLIYAKSEAVKQSWLKALRDERQRVLEDQENDFCVPDHWKQTVLNKVCSQSHLKDKQSGGRVSHGQLMMQKDLKDFTYATLPRHRISQKHDKKKGWFKFGGKKSKR